MNVETSYDEMSKDLGESKVKPEDKGKPSLPEDDVAAFCLWLKNEVGGSVGKVTLSKRLKGVVPAVIYG